SRRRHTRSDRDWSSDVCSSDLVVNSMKTNRPVRVTETDTTLRVATNADEVVQELTRWALLDAGSQHKRLNEQAMLLDRTSAAARSEERRVGKQRKARREAAED